MKRVTPILVAIATLATGCSGSDIAGLGNDGDDLGPAPVGMEGLWDVARAADKAKDRQDANAQIELVQQGVMNTVNCPWTWPAVPGTARVFDVMTLNNVLGYRCWTIFAYEERELTTSFWPDGTRMDNAPGSAPIHSADVKAAYNGIQWLHLNTWVGFQGQTPPSKNLCALTGGYASGSFDSGHNVRFTQHFYSMFVADQDDWPVSWGCP